MGAGNGTAAWTGPSRARFAAVFAGLAMDSEAALTSWAKFTGALAVVAVCLSCFVDHCRRC